MRHFVVSSEDSGKRVDRFIHSVLLGIPYSVLSKAFRKRDVKVNGVRVKEDYLVSEGDDVALYACEERLTRYEKPAALDVVYEDKNILIVNKPRGIPVQDDKGPSMESLIADYSFSISCVSEGFPALCHRLDRNTAGLLLLAKNKNALNILQNKFKHHEIRKKYYCVILGHPEKPSAELKGFLVKDSENSLVRIFHKKVPKGVPIQTNYRVLETNGALSLLEVELITGRTHQIRAHLAFMGHPVLGDGKYGKSSVNRQYGFKQQLLWSTCLEFAFTSDASILNYLKGKSIRLPDMKLKEALFKR